MSDVDNLVQNFITEPGVFFVGVKSLNYKSVAAARGRDHVLPVVGKHLYREFVEFCLGGGRIDSRRTKLHFDDARALAAKAHPAMAADIKAFHFYDLRAKAADDTSDERGVQAASDLLGHDSVKTTQRHYLRRGKIVGSTK